MASERQEDQIRTQGILLGYEELQLKRQTAISEGLMAGSLEELFPGRALHFEEIEGEPKIALGYLKDEFESADALKKKELMPSARAYFCKHCGDWVEGSPRSEKYDDIDRLSGSTGYNLFCIICEAKIGRIIGMRS